eukprot:m.10511 g.10511  ORF g.10511 m.10511 type:complete len:460 (+) comp4273_c0_seq1:85-1464(+)
MSQFTSLGNSIRFRGKRGESIDRQNNVYNDSSDSDSNPDDTKRHYYFVPRVYRTRRHPFSTYYIDKSSRFGLLWFIVQRVPVLNFLYFIVDIAPAFHDIVGMLNTLALIGALLLTMSAAVPLSIESYEMHEASHRWSLRGEYGCYDFAKCHKPYRNLNVRFADTSGLSIYMCSTSLVLCIVTLISAQSLSAIVYAEEDISKRTYGKKHFIKNPRYHGYMVPTHKLQAWWRWARWPTIFTVVPIIPAIALFMQALRSLFMVKFRSENMSELCRDRGWVYWYTDKDGLQIFNHTNNMLDTCLGPFDRDLVKDADEEPARILDSGFHLLMWPAIVTVIVVGYGALWAALAVPREPDNYQKHSASKTSQQKQTEAIPQQAEEHEARERTTTMNSVLSQDYEPRERTTTMNSVISEIGDDYNFEQNNSTIFEKDAEKLELVDVKRNDSPRKIIASMGNDNDDIV